MAVSEHICEPDAGTQGPKRGARAGACLDKRQHLLQESVQELGVTPRETSHLQVPQGTLLSHRVEEWAR